MAYETTEVPIARTQEKIRQMVYAHKGTGLILTSHPPKEGFEALIELGGKSYHIRVTATCKAIANCAPGGWRTRTAKQMVDLGEKECRRVWRALYWHLKGLFEAVDSGIMTVETIIMPYVVLHDGRTLAEHVEPRLAEIVSTGTGKLLQEASV